MVTVGRVPAECFLMTAQVSASGFQVCAAACWGVSFRQWLVAATHRGSISPIRIRSPAEFHVDGGEPSPNATSMRHRAALAAASRQRNVGGAISGGKMDPLRG